MRNIISFMHMSLDGYVAGPGGTMDWITVNEELFEFIGKRIENTGTSLYGRVTFDMMESYWPTAGAQPNASRHDMQHAAWYKKVHKVVMSHTKQDASLTDRTFIGLNLAQEIQELKQQPGNEILLFGSPSATHALLELNLIDGFWLFVNPILLGKGIPLFAGIPQPLKLNRISTHAFDCGVTELNYLVANSNNTSNG